MGVNKSVVGLLKQSGYSGWNFTSIWAIEENGSMAYLQGMKIPEEVYENVKQETIYQGLGTATNPYIMTKGEQLKKIQTEPNAYYKLGTDIDLSGINWTPIGTKEQPFTGNFDGDGHKISNMKIGSAVTGLVDNIGLFGYTSGATISNFTLEDYEITRTSGSYIGGVIGYQENGTLTNVQVKGKITTTDSNSRRIGGAVGYISDGSVKQVKTEVEIKIAGGFAGGIVGSMYQTNSVADRTARIEQCYSSGKIESTNGSYIGGIVRRYSGSINILQRICI